jgi:hypothetical protein
MLSTKQVRLSILAREDKRHLRLFECAQGSDWAATEGQLGKQFSSERKSAKAYD